MDDKQKIQHMLKEGKISAAQAQALEDACRESVVKKARMDRHIQSLGNIKGSNHYAGLMGMALLFLAVGVFILCAQKGDGKAAFFLFIFVLFFAAGAWMIFAVLYNQLIRNRESVLAALSNMYASIQKRLDLVPALVEVSKTYLAHEQETLNSIVSNRNSTGQALEKIAQTEEGENNSSVLVNAQRELDKSIGRIYAVAEQYPELKSNIHFLTIQSELANAEDGILLRRERYNAAVQAYNAAVQQFPYNMFSLFFDFKSFEYFDDNKF